MRYTLTVLLALSIATPATAWEVGHFRDRMTDRQETFATVSSRAAQLYVGCLNGEVQPRLSFPARVGRGELGVSYRFDEGPVVPRIVMVSGDGLSLYLWPLDHAEALAKLKRGKRLRVEVGRAFFDFDLTGGAPLPQIKCAPLSF